MIYDVPVVPQTTNMSCWAASIAMILGWRDQMCIPDEVIARNPGGTSYMTSMTTGLDPNDVYILNRNGFEIVPAQCYGSTAPIIQLLSTYGPLWVATWAPGPHIRVVRGLVGETVHICDPAPVNQGSQYTMSFRNFFGAMENLASREMRERSPAYIARLR